MWVRTRLVLPRRNERFSMPRSPQSGRWPISRAVLRLRLAEMSRRLSRRCHREGQGRFRPGRCHSSPVRDAGCIEKSFFLVHQLNADHGFLRRHAAPQGIAQRIRKPPSSGTALQKRAIFWPREVGGSKGMSRSSGKVSHFTGGFERARPGRGCFLR